MKTETTALALPSNLRKTALAYPDKVQAALANIGSTEEALELLRAGDGWMQLMKDYGADTEAVNAIQRGRLYIQSRLGKLLPHGGKGGRGKNKLVTQGYQFSKPIAARFRKVAAAESQIDDYFDSATGDGEPVEMSTAGFIHFVGSGGNLACKHNNGISHIEWYTPPEYLDAAREVMGGIDLDPASNDYAQKEVRAEKYYTAEQDGLSEEWRGRVWLNPPFKMPLIRQFVGKLCESFTEKSVTQAILLTNNSTDTLWWHSAMELASAVCFTKGRIAFYNQAGEHASPTNGQTFIYFGDRSKEFCKVYSEFGFCLDWTTWRNSNE